MEIKVDYIIYLFYLVFIMLYYESLVVSLQENILHQRRNNANERLKNANKGEKTRKSNAK